MFNMQEYPWVRGSQKGGDADPIIDQSPAAGLIY